MDWRRVGQYLGLVASDEWRQRPLGQRLLISFACGFVALILGNVALWLIRG